MPEQLKNTAGIGFEQKIWDAACTLRGNLAQIADTYKAFTEGKLKDKAGFCAVVSKEDITKQLGSIGYEV